VLQPIVATNQHAVVFFGGALKYLCGRCPKTHEYRLVSTAAVVDAAGLLLARAHGPLADAKSDVRESRLHIILSDGAEIPVRVLVADPELGVVVLGVEHPEQARAHRFAPLTLAPAGAAGVWDELIVLRRFDPRFGCALDVSVAPVNAVDPKPRLTYLVAGLAGDRPLAACFNLQGRLVGFAIRDETVLAAEEFVDLVRQGRSALAKGTAP